LTLTDGRKTVTAYGKAPDKAESSPLTEEALLVRLSKMGNTYLSLSGEDIQIELDADVNLSPADINALRREAAELFESQTREPSRIDYAPKRGVASEEKFLSALFLNGNSYREARANCQPLLNRLTYAFLPITEIIPEGAGAYIPPVITDKELPEVISLLREHKSRGVRYALCGNLGAISLAESLGLTPIGDFRLNITNAESREVYRKMGVGCAILSPELTLPQARDVGGAVIGYGRIPLMLTERCFIKENYGCDSCGTAALTDRRGEKFPMMREHGHRNLILNSKVTYIGDKPEELSRNRIFSSHLLFTVESAEQICSAIKSYTEGKPLVGVEVRRIGGRTTPKDSSDRAEVPKRRSSPPSRMAEQKSSVRPRQPLQPKARHGAEGKGSHKNVSRQGSPSFKKNSRKSK
jgi:putative protease